MPATKRKTTTAKSAKTKKKAVSRSSAGSSSKKSAAKKRPARKVAGGKRELNKEKNRQRILQAALALFRKKGFQHTTTKEISRQARIAEGTLFNYFESKEDLALYFFDQEADQVMAWYRAEESLKDAPVAEKLFALINRHLEHIEPYEDFIGAVYFRALQPRSKLHPLSLDSQERNLRYLRFFQEILDEAEENGEIPALGQLGPYVIGLFYLGIITYWLNDISPGKRRTLAFLDRSLLLGASFVKKGGWEW